MAGIFWTLTTGGKLVLPRRRSEQDTKLLGNLISEQGVTHTLLLPSLYEIFLQHIPQDKLETLNTVILAGESCSVSLCEKHFNILPEANLYNEYGPTEATVWSTAYKITPEGLAEKIPIGKPIANVEVYVLDKNLDPVPMGVTGELYLGGNGISEGYLNNHELSSEYFITNPYDHNRNTLLYRTGDLVSFRKDGNLIFHGRKDDQLKIRGHRVELEEIKTALKNYPHIQDVAIVVTRAHATDQNELTSIDRLYEALGSLEGDEGKESLLHSIENLSDTEVEILLAQMNGQLLNPIRPIES